MAVTEGQNSLLYRMVQSSTKAKTVGTKSWRSWRCTRTCISRSAERLTVTKGRVITVYQIRIKARRWRRDAITWQSQRCLFLEREHNFGINVTSSTCRRRSRGKQRLQVATDVGQIVVFMCVVVVGWRRWITFGGAGALWGGEVGCQQTADDQITQRLDQAETTHELRVNTTMAVLKFATSRKSLWRQWSFKMPHFRTKAHALVKLAVYDNGYLNSPTPHFNVMTNVQNWPWQQKHQLQGKYIMYLYLKLYHSSSCPENIEQEVLDGRVGFSAV